MWGHRGCLAETLSNQPTSRTIKNGCPISKTIFDCPEVPIKRKENTVPRTLNLLCPRVLVTFPTAPFDRSLRMGAPRDQPTPHGCRPGHITSWAPLAGGLIAATQTGAEPKKQNGGDGGCSTRQDQDPLLARQRRCDVSQVKRQTHRLLRKCPSLRRREAQG